MIILEAFKRLLARDQEVVPRRLDANPAISMRILLRRLLPLYVLMIAVCLACAYRFQGSAPPWLSVLVPTVLVTAMIARCIHWSIVIRSVAVSAERVAKSVQRIRTLSPMVVACVTTWLLVLYGYGDIAQQDLIHLSTALLGVVAAVCLSAIPITAALLSGLALTSSAVFFVSGLHPNAGAIAAIQAVLVFVGIWVAFSLQSDFVALSRMREASARRERASFDRAETQSKLASTDGLTGLLNRRAFMDRLLQLVGRSDAQVRLAIIDLDGFKLVNDEQGHLVGDRLLQCLAARLIEHLGNCAVGRLGGDEFAVLFNAEKTDSDPSQAELEEIVTLLSLPVSSGEDICQVSASLGFVSAEASRYSLEHFLEKADFAMYSAKRRPGPSVVVHGEMLDAELRDRETLSSQLRSAKIQDYLDLVYQPIIHAGDHRTIGAEVLARWSSPGLESLSPRKLFDTAIHCGLTSELTLAIVERAARECPLWDFGIALHFNLTGREIMSLEMMTQIVATLESHQARPEQIVFEITEVDVTDASSAAEVMAALKNRGYRFALDDFGSGVSSLNRVLELPIDMLKIDGRLIRNVARPENRAVISAAVDLARSLGLPCVLEGIENTAQESCVRDLGGELMQGYLFATPSSALSTLLFIANATSEPLDDQNDSTQIAYKGMPACADVEISNSRNLLKSSG